MTSPKSDRPPFSWQACWISIIQRVGHPVLLTGLVLAVTIAGGRYLGLMQGMELASYDHFTRRQPDQGEDDRLLVVGITEQDLQQLQEWPISDQTLLQALQTLEQQNPRAIGIDVLRDLPFEPGRAELLQHLQQSDRTVVVCKASAVDDPGTPPPPGVPPESVGFADLVVDAGGILRRNLLLMSPPGDSVLPGTENYCNDTNNTLLSLNFQMALRYLQAEGITPEFTETGELWLADTHLRQFQPNSGGYARGDNGGYQILMRYRSEERATPVVSLMEVLNGTVSPDLVRDRLVFIGYTTPQAKDDFYTPYSAGRQDDQKMPGVVVHAQATSQILQAVLDGRSLIWYWSEGAEAGWILAWAFTGGAIAWWLRRPLTFGIGIATATGAAYGVCYIAFLQGLWLPLVPAVMGIMATAVGVILLERFGKTTYGQTVYRQVKQFLHIEIDEDKLQKQVAEITETDYFQDLQSTVKNLRSQRHSREPSASKQKDEIHQHHDDHDKLFPGLEFKNINHSEASTPDPPDPSTPDPSSKQPSVPALANSPNRSLPDLLGDSSMDNAKAEQDDDDENDYFAQLKQDIKQLKQD